MSTVLTFSSNLPTTPTFVDYGSKIEVPDIQVVFWGPYWPGTGQLTVGGLMQAVSTIVNGPYLEGLKQYGFTGTVNLRQPPIVNTGNPNYTLPAPGPNVNQSLTTGTAVLNLVNVLAQNNSLGSTAGKHDILVVVFVDPSFAFPSIYDSAGNLVTTVFGAHSAYIYTQPLQPSIRFCYLWVGTQAGAGLSAFDQTTMTLSHELAESISNPFPAPAGTAPSGLVQTSPPPGPNAGEIGDICNNTFCVVDGIVVQPYWGVQQAACILPIETRSVSLNQTLTKHDSHDGPTQYAVVNMGPLCGTGSFDYVERTYDTIVTVTAVHPGYQTPVYQWSINGKVLKPGNSTMAVPCIWNSPAGSTNFHAVSDHPQSARVPQAAGAAALGPGGHALNAASLAAMHGASSPVIGGEHVLPGADPVKPGVGPANGPLNNPNARDLAGLRLTVFDSLLVIECGPDQGNVSLNVACQMVENWDNVVNTKVTTQHTATAVVNMDNQEIIWGTAYQKAADDCYAKTNKGKAGGIPGIPLNPGDPGPEGTVNRIVQAEQAAEQAQHIRQIGQKINKQQ